jgi:uncharacterized protein (DUF1778 family)
MSALAQATERLSFRVNSEKKNVIERAAAAKGLSLTEFAVMTLLREAKEVLKSEHVLVLSDADRDAFLAALDNPPQANKKALGAARRYKLARAKGEVR